MKTHAWHVTDTQHMILEITMRLNWHGQVDSLRWLLGSTSGCSLHPPWIYILFFGWRHGRSTINRTLACFTLTSSLSHWCFSFSHSFLSSLSLKNKFKNIFLNRLWISLEWWRWTSAQSLNPQSISNPSWVRALTVLAWVVWVQGHSFLKGTVKEPTGLHLDPNTENSRCGLCVGRITKENACLWALLCLSHPCLSYWVLFPCQNKCSMLMETSYSYLDTGKW